MTRFTSLIGSRLQELRSLLQHSITIAYLKMKPKDAVVTFGETLNELKVPIYSIGMVLSFAFIANYSGMSSTLALALAHTGSGIYVLLAFLGLVGRIPHGFRYLCQCTVCSTSGYYSSANWCARSFTGGSQYQWWCDLVR